MQNSRRYIKNNFRPFQRRRVPNNISLNNNNLRKYNQNNDRNRRVRFSRNWRNGNYNQYSNNIRRNNNNVNNNRRNDNRGINKIDRTVRNLTKYVKNFSLGGGPLKAISSNQKKNLNDPNSFKWSSS